MPIATYTSGPAKRPNINHDNGFLDKYPYRAPGWRDRLQRKKAIMLLTGGEAVQGIPLVPHNHLPDALATYRHFLYGNGQDRDFSYERYVADDPSGSVTLKNALLDAQAGAIEIFVSQYGSKVPSKFSITSTAIAASTQSRLFPYPLTENWQKAIGAHFIWMSADVEVSGDSKAPLFRMVCTLHAEDRYNFNPGAADIATGIPDEMNGILEITRLARQYTNYSTLNRIVTWTGTTPAPSDHTSSGSPSRRTRQPSDNRRVRSRL
jgi:hypothetical protein